MTTTDDFSVTANPGTWLEPEPPLPKPEPVSKDFIPDNNVDESVDFRPTPDPMFKAKGERDIHIGTDGDDIGRAGHHQAVGDMLDSGHGFLVRNAPAAPKTVWRETCEVCGGELPTPDDDGPDWLCQYFDETRPASLMCNCPWCLKYQDYMAGRYKPQGGRPRQRCGSAVCDRKAKTAKQKQQRLQKRREALVAEFGQLDEPEPTLEGIADALASIDRIPEQYREGVRAKLEAKRENFDHYEPPRWNSRKRGRNEPNWHLSNQRRKPAGRG